MKIKQLLDYVTNLIPEPCDCRIELGCFVDHLEDLHISLQDVRTRFETVASKTVEASVSEEQQALGEKIIAYINEHYALNDICLAKIAEEFDVSISSITHLVRVVGGNTYKQMLTELRVEKACELLIQTRLSVADVCCAVGYNNLSHFIKLFKGVKGITPAAFRKAHEGDEPAQR